MRTSKISLIATRVAPEKIFAPGEFPIGWFAVSHHCIGEKKERRLTTGKWFCIQSGKAKVYRVLRFLPRLSFTKKEGKGEIVMDYNGWLELSDFPEDTEQPLSLSIRRARKYEYLRCILTHPDPHYHLAAILAIISLGLGVVGLILGIISLFT